VLIVIYVVEVNLAAKGKQWETIVPFFLWFQYSLHVCMVKKYNNYLSFLENLFNFFHNLYQRTIFHIIN